MPTTTTNKPVRRTPIRTCVACRTSGGKRGLLRVVRLPEGAGIVLDPTGKKNGRGAYLCPTTACVQMAIKRKALERSLKVPLSEEIITRLLAHVAEEETIKTEKTETVVTSAETPETIAA